MYHGLNDRRGEFFYLRSYSQRAKDESEYQHQRRPARPAAAAFRTGKIMSRPDFPLPSSHSNGEPELALEVTCREDRDEMYAAVPETGTPDRLYAELHAALLPGGLAFMESDHGGDKEELLPPPTDTEQLQSEFLNRLRRFARRFKVPPANWRFFVDRGRKIRTVPTLTFPASWQNAGTLRASQKIYRSDEEFERLEQAGRHTEEGARLLAEGRYRKAMRLFKEARAKDPGYYLPALFLAELALSESSWEEAGHLLDEAGKLFRRDGPRTKKQFIRDGGRLEAAGLRLREARLLKAATQAAAPAAAAAGPKPAQAPEAPVDWSAPHLPAWLAARYTQGPFDSLARYRLRLEAEQVRTLGSFNELLSPAQSRILPFEHQVRAVRVALRRMRGRALLADEVGLGKTIEAGLALKEYLLRGMAARALILVPPVLTEQWREELSTKFGIEAAVFMGEDGPEGACWGRPGVAVASLALAKREPHRSRILAQSYDVVIVDEAHHLRRRQTLAWRLVNELKTKFLFLLTATPIQNDLDELYSLATLLRPGQLGTPAQFGARFKERGDGRKPRNPGDLRALLREVMIRHTRASAAVVLPRRVARTVSVPMEAPERAAYEELSSLVRSLGSAAGKNPLFLLTLLQREAGSDLHAALPTLAKIEPRLAPPARARLKELSAAITGLSAPGKWGAVRNILAHHPGKCLIFTEFRATQARLAAALTAAGESVEIFHGGLSPAQKSEVMNRFEGPARILLSTPAGGEGVNLQFCRVLVNYDLPWNPMRIEQRIGRLHRLGQTGEVMIYNLASPDTVEHHLLRILSEKLNLFELVVGEAETILGELTEDKEFEQILMETWLEAADAREAGERMEQLGERIMREKESYMEIKKLDESMFGSDYEAA